MTTYKDEFCSRALEGNIIQPLDLMKVKYIESPNKSDRNKDIRFIVLHHTGPGNLENIVKWLCDPVAKASAHYVIGYNGEIVQLVNTKRKAWHAGVSEWTGLKDINEYSIGIEICNLGILHKDEQGYFYESGRGIKRYNGTVEPNYSTITYPNGATVDGWHIPYPKNQIDALISLCKGLIKKYPQITKQDILTHYQIGMPLGRKNDPFGINMLELIEKIM